MRIFYHNTPLNLKQGLGNLFFFNFTALYRPATSRQTAGRGLFIILSSKRWNKREEYYYKINLDIQSGNPLKVFKRHTKDMQKKIHGS